MSSSGETYDQYLLQNNFSDYKLQLSNLSTQILNDAFCKQQLRNESSAAAFCPYVFKSVFSKNAIDQNVNYSQEVNGKTSSDSWSINVLDLNTSIRVYSLDIDQYIYLFGLPINLYKINGIYLLKLAQMRFPLGVTTKVGSLSLQYPFQGSVQFARLFCLYYAYLIKLQDNQPQTFKYETQIFDSTTVITINMVLDALCLMFLKYYYILRFGQVKQIDSSGQIKYQINLPLIEELLSLKNNPNAELKKKISEYQQDTEGSSADELAYYLYKKHQTLVQFQTLMFVKKLIQISDFINLTYITNGQYLKNSWGYVIPNEIIFDYNYLKWKMYKIQDEYFRTHDDNTSKYNITQINSLTFYVSNGGQASNINVTQANDLTIKEDEQGNIIQVDDNTNINTIQAMSDQNMSDLVNGALSTTNGGYNHYYYKKTDGYQPITVSGNKGSQKVSSEQTISETGSIKIYRSDKSSNPDNSILFTGFTFNTKKDNLVEEYY